MWTQQLSGVSRQSLSYERFVYRESDVDNVWAVSLYPTVLMNCKIIIDKAAEEGSPHYAGVAKVLTAYTLGVMTDVWGDIPYSQAFQGSKELTPAFDTQEQIYAAIDELLDDAITDLAAQTSTLSPGSSDLMYAGDLGMWTKAACTIRARYALHLTKKDSIDASNKALQHLANGFGSNAEDLEFVFGSNNLEENPTYQFDRDRGDIRVGAKIVDMMNTTGDPRLPFYAAPDENGAYTGAGPGSANGSASWIGPGFASPTSPVPFISYTELLYIKAEALLKTGDNAGAIAAYNDALQASLEKHGVFDQTWFDANKFTGATIDLATIIWGKYVSLFMQPEVFVDMRRTDLLQTLTIPTAATLSEFPRRWPYATSEKTYNTANVPSVSLTSKLWWDQ
jgi:hypothetical protein